MLIITKVWLSWEQDRKGAYGIVHCIQLWSRAGVLISSVPHHRLCLGEAEGRPALEMSQARADGAPPPRSLSGLSDAERPVERAAMRGLVLLRWGAPCPFSQSFVILLSGDSSGDGGDSSCCIGSSVRPPACARPPSEVSSAEATPPGSALLLPCRAGCTPF